MKIAIHNRPGSFSDRWIEYCENQKVNYKIVNCYDNDIIEQLQDCDGLMWHHHHTNYKDVLFAKQLLFSLQQSGKKIFPDFNTSWHFDDKVGQKYLLESIDAPLVPTYVFYSREEALAWAASTSFPKVFKLRGGAGSANVKLVRNLREATKLINKAFGKGFPQFDRLGYLKERVRKVRAGQDSIIGIAKGIGRLFIPTQYSKMKGRERGYVYFQEFVKNEGFDVRVVTIGKKAVALKRMVRDNDFRASGSGELIFENERIDKRYIKRAFDLASKLNMQSIAFDFIKDLSSNIYLVELSYAFPMSNFLDGASGYWDEDLTWHNESFNLQGWIVEAFISKTKDPR